MGTRSLTVFKDNDKEICVLYRQFDGYPDGHGLELSEFLNGFKIVNGYTQKDKENPRIANGMGCLSAQVIADFKKEIGNFYLYPAGTRDCWEEYIYYVSADEKGNPVISCFDVYSKKKLFSGTPADFIKKYKKNR